MSTVNVYLILFAFLVSSCSRVQIKDSEWCGDMGKEGAYCFNTLSDGSRPLLYEEWNRERFGMVCTKSENFTDWKKSILKLCRISKSCTYSVKQKVITFHDKIKFYELKLSQDGMYESEE